ncbi:alpha/beta fold hydrolase [Nocardia xishanensis]|uniref:Thioesterase TesA n=1 Tax=Nocardia xishanensis TaxID=238964 RepID=A0ABW7XC19_9NOCA
MTRTDDDRLWLRRFDEAPQPAARLVCLPHAGGSASYFRGVSRALAPRIEVLAVQAPGRQDRRREPCVESIPDLADAVAARLLDRADTPIALFGHSMGALVAFEIARRLTAIGVRPLALFVSGRRAPFTHRAEETHLLDDDALLDHLRSLDGTDGRILSDPDMVSAILPVTRADYRAIGAYRYLPGPPLTMPIHVHLGDADPHVTVAEAEQWRQHTTDEFAVHVYPGGHFYLEEHSARLIRSLDAVIVGQTHTGRAESSTTSPVAPR